MKTALSSVAVLLLALAAHAAEPLGRYLLLDNEQLVEGEVRREGNRYVVKRGAGEASIPVSRVAEVAADRDAVHRIMRGRCNLRDADDRLRLIRWLMANNLRPEALREAEELARFRPDDQQTRALLEGLRRPEKSPPDLARATTPKVLDKVVEVERPRYNPESYPLFVAKVQPILMNLCIRCHADGQGGGLQLLRAVDGGDRKASAHNLAAATKFLDHRDPTASRLLEKAVTAHGAAIRPPLRDRQTPAYQFLESWARIAVAGVEVPTAVVAVPPPAPLPKDVIERPKPPLPTTGVFGETSTSQASPEPQTEAKDPFDPAIFNGTIQPKK